MSFATNFRLVFAQIYLRFQLLNIEGEITCSSSGYGQILLYNLPIMRIWRMKLHGEKGALNHVRSAWRLIRLDAPQAFLLATGL